MSCDNVITVQDLETDKKHSTFYREVITGKAGGTGADIDSATNAVTGQVQKTLPKILDDLDWSYVGLFADGVTFTDKTDFAVDADGVQWIYTGTLPFSATAGTVPSEPTYQAVYVSSHAYLSDLNPGGGLAHNASDISNMNGGTVYDNLSPSFTLWLTDSEDFPVKFNSLMNALGNSPARVEIQPADFTLIVDTESLMFKKNKIIDFGWNTIKLANGASKYIGLLAPDGNIDGFLELKNFKLNGNKTGGQTRRYNTSVSTSFGVVYEAYQNYTGFGLCIYGVDRLYIHDYEIDDSESWGIAHFSCGDTLFERAKYDGFLQPSQNGDGVTGVACRSMVVRDVTGYTNDDLTAISTSRATLNSRQVFNPEHGRDCELFSVNNVIPFKKLDSRWPYNIAGVYVSDGFKIKKVSIGNTQGYYNLHCARIGNYWAGSPYLAPNGTIEDIDIYDINATNLTNGKADCDISNVEILFMKLGLRSIKNTTLVGNLTNSNLVALRENALVRRLKLEDWYYYNNSTPSDSTHSVVDCDSSSSLIKLEIDGELDISSGLELVTTTYRNRSSNLTKLWIGNFQVKSSVSIDYINPKNIAYDFSNVRVITTGVLIRDSVSLPTNVTAGTLTPYIVRHGARAWLDGELTIGASYTLGANLIESLPIWSRPLASQARCAMTSFKAGSNSQAPFVVVKSSGNCGTISGNGGDFSSSTVYLNGISWSCV